MNGMEWRRRRKNERWWRKYTWVNVDQFHGIMSERAGESGQEQERNFASFYSNNTLNI